MMDGVYKAREFAELAGVTVRALHHYDRIGLLKPQRSRSGYRLYSLTHLERLEQIRALKFLGIPLKEIKTLLESSPLTLGESLELQRRALAEKRDIITRAIHAIEAAEELVRSDQSLTEDPASEKAQALAVRWTELKGDAGDHRTAPQQEDFQAILRQKSPLDFSVAVVNQVARLYRIEQVSSFLAKALACGGDKRNSA
jgi:DNA-binding transcriptional MerR regulator